MAQLPVAIMDDETYSEAGYVFSPALQKWESVVNSAPHGLGAVGVSVYTEHPSCRYLSKSYDIRDGLGPRLWIPGCPDPYDLFDHIARGGLIEAHNSGFEWHMWENVAHKRMGWPALPYWQLRCSASKCRAYSIPGSLKESARVLGVTNQKIDDGARLIAKFSKPRNPTAKDPRLCIRPEEDEADAVKLYEYNVGDIKAEADVSAALPELSAEELETWLLDQCINLRGVSIDKPALDACGAIVEQCVDRYTRELEGIVRATLPTDAQWVAARTALGAKDTLKHILYKGELSVGSLSKLRVWLYTRGLVLDNMQEETIDATLLLPIRDPSARRALEIRQLIGSAAVKKVGAISRRLSADGRLRDLFAYHGAGTGRWAGRGPQPQNLPKSGPDVMHCENGCGHYYGTHLDKCPWCQCLASIGATRVRWRLEAVEDALAIVASRDLHTVEYFFGDALAVVSGCLRGLFVASDGCDLVCSDYSAIEGVVLAVLAGEEWRVEAYRTHGKVYEMAASKITGIPFEEILAHKKKTGEHHPARRLGKTGELSGQYQGWVGAWCNFGADEFMTEDEMIAAIKAWRAMSPMTVKYWYAMENCAIQAIQNPGVEFSYRGISFSVDAVRDVLRCRLLSGRYLHYHKPLLVPEVRYGKDVLKITFEGVNSNPKRGPVGTWMRLDTYGGSLTENVVQATARDILAYAMKNLERAGYSIVLHVHDEPVAEVMSGTGSVEEFERIMATLPPWATGWPLRAAGGWRGRRYRKE